MEEGTEHEQYLVEIIVIIKFIANQKNRILLECRGSITNERYRIKI